MGRYAWQLLRTDLLQFRPGPPASSSVKVRVREKVKKREGEKTERGKKKKETTDGRTEDFAQTVCDIATRLSWEE